MFDVDQVLREQAAMETERSAFESQWQLVAEHLLPRQADFLGGFGTPGARRNDRIFDETAMQALEHGVSVFEGEVIPKGGIWQRRVARDPELMKVQRVALWFETLTSRQFALRNNAYSGWGSQTHESGCSLFGFGNQAMWTDFLIDPASRERIGIGYRSEHIGDLYIRENALGQVHVAHRKFKLTHEQALQQWPDSPPEVAVKAQRDKANMQGKAEYLHVISPNPKYDPSRLDFQAMRYRSGYISLSDKQLFNTGGYRTMRLTYSRYEKSPTETYGRGPGMNVLPAVMATQQMMADLITSVEFMARPALGAVDDMKDQTIFYEPDSVTYGAIDHRGNKLIGRLWEDPDLTEAKALLLDTRRVIERAFFMDLYGVREEVKSHVSATEWMQRAQERGILLAPLLRQQDEWFTPLSDVELDLMGDMGMLDDMPPEVVEAGGMSQVLYENPLTRARKADEAGGFYQLMNGLAPWMQADPSIYGIFRKRYSPDRVLEMLEFVHAVPPSIQTTAEEREQIEAQEAAQAQMATLLDTGQAAAGIAKDLSASGLADAA